MAEVRHSISELNQLFSEGETADREIFAEQRSNIQLVAGEHYTKKGEKFWNRLRDSRNIPKDQKIRLAKNHIRKIVLAYRNSITTYAPGVMASPKDKASMQHQKSSELCNSVWADGKARHDFNNLINQLANDFCSIGECALKIFFDPSAGKFLGEEAALDEMGQVMLDEMGNPVSSGVPKFTGDVMVERLFSFNIIRPSGCKDIKKAEWLSYRKMVSTKEVRSLVDSSNELSDEEKDELKAKINDSPDQTYTILDGNTGSYRTVKDQTMLKEFYFKPCVKYPNGYFFICVDQAILFSGELPFGLFPIVFAGFDEIQTSPRFRSIVKQLRPYQVEINRCASKIAEHQITLGDDKILIQNGAKLTPGVALPGVRSLQYSGMTPIVLEGRSGVQYLDYMNAQISEMYSVAMVEEQREEKQPGQMDVYSMLFKSIKDKKKFSVYTDTFESFLKQFFDLYIKTCQKYYGEVHLIPAIGKSEYINVAEFKEIGDLDFVVVLEPQTDDSETKLGRQLALNHIVQYAGNQLGKEDLGKLIRMMPYANDQRFLEDLTMDYDVAENYMLALDRGQMPEPNMYDNHEYLIRKLVNRTRQPDFVFLEPQFQQNYQMAIQTHEQLKVQQEIQLKQAQSEFIPTGGYLVACDFYVPDKEDPSKLPKRVRIPSEAMQWLLDRLATQGTDQKSMDMIGNQGALAQMSNMFLNQLNNGQTSPGGLNGY